jgi:hypothetical protein
LRLCVPEPRPPVGDPVSHALYDYLSERYGADAYSRYNSLLRRLASFASALEQQEARRQRLKGAPQ